MAEWEFGREEIGPIRDALLAGGPFDRVRLTNNQLSEFMSAICGFLGGSLTNADAFVTELPTDDNPELKVMWLRGNALGSLAVAAPGGPEGEVADEPAQISGYVRPLSDVRRVEIIGAESSWPFVNEGFPTIWPEVGIHFDDQMILIKVSGRPSAKGREQAADFVDKLLELLGR